MRLSVAVSAVLSIVLAAAAGCEQKPGIANSYQEQGGDVSFQQGVNLPPSAKTLLAMARILAVQDKDEEATYVFGRLMMEHPTFLPGYCEFAELHMRHHRIEEAMRVLTAGLAVHPDDPVLRNNLGMCHLLRGNHEAALEQFSRAAAADPANARYRANVGVALGLMGRYDESLTVLQQVLAPGESHYNLGVLAEAREDFDQAADSYARARQAGYEFEEEQGP